MTYDYVIVGAGSSGATLASRLTEDPHTTVLLLESGPDYRSADTPLEIQSPNPSVMWTLEHFSTYRYPNLKARYTPRHTPQFLQRGRGVGGTSTVNGQVAIRGLPEDYDLWAEEGASGWSWADVLPAFRRLEDDEHFGDAPYHGRGGPIPIYRAPLERWSPVDLAVRSAALDLGYGWCEDHNAPEGTGVSPYAINSRNGRRVSTNDAYLEPARGRPNLTILGEAMVDHVLFEGRRATGVRYRRGGQWAEAQGREVVLSAGTIHSPAILMRSGVGPGDHLQALGIPVVLDSPMVGQQLTDHPGIGVRLPLKPEARASDLHTRFTNCCVRYSSGLAGAGRNDMLMIAFNNRSWDVPLEEHFNSGRIRVSAYQAFSRGWVRITTPDPEVDPDVDINMLADERDLVRVRDAARRVFQIVRHPAVQSILASPAWGEIVEVPMADLEALGDAQLDEWARGAVTTFQHLVGTCRMGSPGQHWSVVDPECRVIGLEGLRVIDASIMPEVPRANTHLTCVMIGEHAATRLRASRR